MSNNIRLSISRSPEQLIRFALTQPRESDKLLLERILELNGEKLPGDCAMQLSGAINSKQAIAAAILLKGGTISADMPLADYAARIVSLPSSPVTGNPADGPRIRFFDYDGTLLGTRYVKPGETAEAPPLPLHDRLAFQGWNNSPEHPAADKDIGAIYQTASGAAEFDLEFGSLDPRTIALKHTVRNGTALIDWGDGSSNSHTGTYLETHTYTAPGNYTIRLTASDGAEITLEDSMFSEDGSENYSLIAAFLSGNIREFSGKPFRNCRSLRHLTIPGECRGSSGIGENCSSLTALNLPVGITALDSGFLAGAAALQKLTLPDTIGVIGQEALSGLCALRELVLPAAITELPPACISECSGLHALTLPAGLITLSHTAFSGCGMLQQLTSFAEIPPALTGELPHFIKKLNVPQGCLPIYQGSTNWNVFADCTEEQEYTFAVPENPLTLTAVTPASVRLDFNGNTPFDGLQYRLNNSPNWDNYTPGTKVSLNNPGDSVQFQNRNIHSFSISNYLHFTLQGTVCASGNTHSLLNYCPRIPAFAFYRLFSGCSTLKTPPELPAIKLSAYCYGSMFNGCSALEYAPELPAEKLETSCYNSMFSGCQSLKNRPELPAKTLAANCYTSMFYNCTGITSGGELPAEILAGGCYYNMFYNCTSLLTAPALPVTALATDCYKSMFNGCSSLQTAPDLPAEVLISGCYSGMFNGCKALTAAPAIAARALVSGCCTYMFNNCSNLQQVTVHFTEWTSGATTSWLAGTAANGTFSKPAELPPTTGVSAIPANWNIINQ